MNLTTKQLKRIIKEELGALMESGDIHSNPYYYIQDAFQTDLSSVNVLTGVGVQQILSNMMKDAAHIQMAPAELANFDEKTLREAGQKVSSMAQNLLYYFMDVKTGQRERDETIDRLLELFLNKQPSIFVQAIEMSYILS